MNELRERILYKDVPVHICFGSLTRKEQYACIRLLAATRTHNVTICSHKSTNSYIDTLISELLHVGLRHTDSCKVSPHLEPLRVSEPVLAKMPLGEQA